MTTYPHPIRLHKPHVNPWVLVVALAAALVGLTSWVIVDQTSSGAAQPTQGLASAKVAAMLDSRFAALNSGGKLSLASYYSPNAVFEDFGVTPPLVVRGNPDVATLMGTYARTWAMSGTRITRESEVIQTGQYAAHGLRLGNTRGMAVFQLDKHGKIAHQWAFGSG